MDKEVIVFGVVGWNIAETTRMIEIAKALPDSWKPEFASYGGKFEHLVEEAGFVLHRLKPEEDDEKIELLWKIDRGEKFAQPFKKHELRTRVAGEVELFRKLNAVAAVMGSVLTFPISARAAQIPLINVIPFALSRMYFKNNLPAAPGKGSFVSRIFRWAAENIPLLTGNFSKVAAEHGLPPFRNLLSLWEGDINLLTELPELFPEVRLERNWHFAGPIFAKLDVPVPVEAEELFSEPGEPIVYFAMGSSANRQVLQTILPWLGDLPVRVIAPIKDHLAGFTGTIPSNVTVTGWLPAHKVNPRCTAAIIHGGQGTVQTACMSGVPFLGIGMQPEQSINIQTAVDYGAALRLSRKKLDRKKFLSLVTKLLEDEALRKRATELAAVSGDVDGAKNAAVFLDEFLSHRPLIIPLTPYTKKTRLKPGKETS